MAGPVTAPARDPRAQEVLSAHARAARRQLVVVGLSVGALVAAVLGFGAWLSLTPAAVIEGIGRIVDLVGRMFPIETAGFRASLDAIWKTYLYAVAGTVLAVAGAIPMAYAAAGPTSAHPAVRAAARSVLAFFRAVPDIVFALIFVAALGLGPTPGVLALALHSAGILGRQFADAIEDLEAGPSTALLGVGASRLQVAAGSILPRVAPVSLGLTLFRLEINVRTSVVLGFVGAGGIGFLLQGALGTLRYQAAALYIAEILVLILVNERIAEALRWRVSGRRGGRARDHEGQPTTGEGRRRLAAGAGWLVAIALGVLAFRASGLRPADVWQVPKAIATTIVDFRPIWPDNAGHLLVELGQTFAIGFIATVLGYALAVVLGIGSAGGLGGRWLSRTIMVVLSLMRGIPDLVLALIFVAAVGLGPTAGVLALAVATVAFGGKLVAEVLAEQERGAELAMTAAGATVRQATSAATLPVAAPALTALGLFVLDVNVRSSVVLGVVGAGGIGFDLLEALRTFDYRLAGFMLSEIFVLVLALEAVSVLARRRLGTRMS
jgi:phosphonate transport system permease protein